MIASRAVIQLYRVTKRYPNGIEALRDVSVHVHEGEFVFLSGPSGSGKTTFIKLIAPFGFSFIARTPVRFRMGMSERGRPGTCAINLSVCACDVKQAERR